MELTQEQVDIVNSTGNIKINAVAGSGKTTTIIEYAASRPVGSRILYLAFNRTVKTEAALKFSEKGLKNVKVETAHSLAYKNVMPRHQYIVKHAGYKANEIAEQLDLKVTGEKHAEYVVANHINKFITYFCNSDKRKVQELNYLDTVSDEKAKKFVTTFYDFIENKTRLLLSRMDKGEMEITHDFYLKKFQLSTPHLPYDYILFDEGQDASAAMLDIFLNQQAVKVIVGDTHQQIYGWRYAVNSLQKTDFKTYHLSTSFRFGSDIAQLAQETLKLKNHLEAGYPSISIVGKGTATTSHATNAVLARTNLGLLLHAINYVTSSRKTGPIYFEGNINSYTYADEGASLYDVLNLYNGKRYLIKDKLIKAVKDLDELEDYIEKTEDVQLGMMVELVKEYENEIPAIIKRIKERHIENEDKRNAEVIFSTVHRCKGMEYDTVQLANDFITEEKLTKRKDEKGENLNVGKLLEEINLLYVAITRARNKLYIPKAMVPEGWPVSTHVHIIEDVKKDENAETKPADNARQKTQYQKKYTVADERLKSKDAYKPWSTELDDELTELYCKGLSVAAMAQHFGRTKGAILSRIKKLELEDLYD